MKIKVINSFKYEGKQYDEGKIVDLPEQVAKEAINDDFAEKHEGTPELGSDSQEGGVEISTSDDDAYKQIEQDIQGEKETPDSWNPSRDDPPEPDEHPMLIGDVVRMGIGGQNDTRFAVIRDREGEENTLWNHKVLDDMFKQMETGDRVGVRYTGKEKSGESKWEYLKYRYSLRDKNGNEKVTG